MENFRYLRVFKMAGIDLQRGEMICSLLSDTVLDRLTKRDKDMRLIAPILRDAEEMRGGITDDNINALLDNQNYISSLICRYCR